MAKTVDDIRIGGKGQNGTICQIDDCLPTGRNTTTIHLVGGDSIDDKLDSTARNPAMGPSTFRPRWSRRHQKRCRDKSDTQRKLSTHRPVPTRLRDAAKACRGASSTRKDIRSVRANLTIGGRFNLVRV